MDISYHELRLFWSPQWSWSYCSCWSSPPLPDTLSLSMFDWLLPDLPDNNISFSSLSDWVGSILSSRPSLQVFFESSRSPWDRYNPDDPRPCPRSLPLSRTGWIASWQIGATLRGLERTLPTPPTLNSSLYHPTPTKLSRGAAGRYKKIIDSRLSLIWKIWKKLKKYNPNPARRLSS